MVLQTLNKSHPSQSYIRWHLLTNAENIGRVYPVIAVIGGVLFITIVYLSTVLSDVFSLGYNYLYCLLIAVSIVFALTCQFYFYFSQVFNISSLIANSIGKPVFGAYGMCYAILSIGLLRFTNKLDSVTSRFNYNLVTLLLVFYCSVCAILLISSVCLEFISFISNLYDLDVLSHSNANNSISGSSTSNTVTTSDSTTVNNWFFSFKKVVSDLGVVGITMVSAIKVLPGGPLTKVEGGIATGLTLAGAAYIMRTAEPGTKQHIEATNAYNAMMSSTSTTNATTSTANAGSSGSVTSNLPSNAFGTNNGSGSNSLVDNIVQSSSPTYSDPVMNMLNDYATGVMLVSISIAIFLSIGLWSLFVLSNKEKVISWINNSKIRSFSPLLTYYFIVNKIGIIYVFGCIYLSLFIMIYGSVKIVFSVLPNLV